MTDPGSDANRLAAASLAAGDPTGWFDELYRDAADGNAVVPWDRGEPNPLLVSWAAGRRLAGRAVVVGAGLGRDAEFVATLGLDVTAFDVSPTAAEQAAALHPGTSVTYLAADLLTLPADWLGAFDFVLESFTVQALPVHLHSAATDAVVSLVAPGGTLLAIGGVGVAGEDVAGPPWPLVPAEIDRFSQGPLTEVSREQVEWRWRVELTRI